jgi:threonine/homoserine/homoserine lactone efflux protein
MESVGIINFRAFLAAGILLNLTPGTDTMYILARSMARGTRAGVFSVLGISTGSLIHTLAAACGLSMLLATSAAAFSILKYCGAVYLIYLGIRALLWPMKTMPGSEREDTETDYRRIYLSGILTNVLNPKVALFFLAFLPQFIDQAYPHTMLSFILLGSTFIMTGTCWCLLLAVYSVKFFRLLQERSNAGNLLGRVSGIVFIGMGIKLAVLQR